MELTNRYDQLGEDARKLIRCKARRLVGCYGFTVSDVQDIEQDLALDLLRRLPKYDPSRARISTYISRLVEHCIATLIEKRNAECRDWSQCRDSLDAPARGGDPEDTALGEHYADPNNPTSDDIAARLDIADVLAQLPPELRDTWEVCLHENVTSAARRLGVCRGTVYVRLGRIREAFAAAGVRPGDV